MEAIRFVWPITALSAVVVFLRFPFSFRNTRSIHLGLFDLEQLGVFHNIG